MTLIEHPDRFQQQRLEFPVLISFLFVDCSCLFSTITDREQVLQDSSTLDKLFFLWCTYPIKIPEKKKNNKKEKKKEKTIQIKFMGYIPKIPVSVAPINKTGYPKENPDT